MPIKIPALGLGCVSLTQNTSSIIDYALEKGVTLFDTADCYGNGASELALGQKLKTHDRQKVVICSKVGVRFTTEGVELNGQEKYIEEACEASLKRLQTSYIDIYYLHRVDPNTRIEISMKALAKLVSEKKIKAIGLSEVTERQIRRAQKIHPIAVVQIEYSPWSRQDETNGVMEACRELDIAVVAYSPLGRGFFTQQNTDYFNSLPISDYRYILPRYRDDNLKNNLLIRDMIQEVADKKKCSLAQLVLAWEMAKNIITIPSTTDPKHFDENLGANYVKLSAEDVSALDKLLDKVHFVGRRYPDPKISAIYPEHIPTYWNKKNLLIGVSFLATLGGLFAYSKMIKKGEPALEVQGSNLLLNGIK